jgi:hypothetical protein
MGRTDWRFSLEIPQIATTAGAALRSYMHNELAWLVSSDDWVEEFNEVLLHIQVRSCYSIRAQRAQDKCSYFNTCRLGVVHKSMQIHPS